MLGWTAAEQAEVVFTGKDAALTRFAESVIHQNVAARNHRLAVRVAFGKKVGHAATNSLDEASLRSALRQAEAVARLQPDDPDFVAFPLPAPVKDMDELTFFAATATHTPEARAAAVREMVGRVSRLEAKLAGSFAVEAGELAVVNSHGVRQYCRLTKAGITTLVSKGGGSGYAEAVARDITELDLIRTGEAALAKCLAGQHPRPIEPGEYTVILEPAAVADMVDFLAMEGLNATALQEGRSFMEDSRGKKIMDERISIWDDGSDPQGLPLPFDFEGVPKERVNCVERGVAREIVYDSYTAGREAGKLSTGHGLPAPNPYGPLPLHLHMAAGDATLSEMIEGTEKGILVTRFHYTNTVHPKQVIITGMTRDGTFLVENGRIVSPLPNLRFTDSVLRMLAAVESVGRERKRQATYFGACCVPALKINGFRFTGC